MDVMRLLLIFFFGVYPYLRQSKGTGTTCSSTHSTTTSSCLLLPPGGGGGGGGRVPGTWVETRNVQ